MITLIEAKNYRCLRYVSQPLGSFHVLVGPNASGKTTFLDVVSFLGRLLSGGIDVAIGDRTDNLQDLLWNRSGLGFELAIEAQIPQRFREMLEGKWEIIRYEVSLGAARADGEVHLIRENVLFKAGTNTPTGPRTEYFPEFKEPPQTLLTGAGTRHTRSIVTKVPGGNDNFYSEVEQKGKGWRPAFKIGPRKSALSNLPEDESKFPVSTWLKNFLTEGIQEIVLNSALIKKASPPRKSHRFMPDGSNLPWVIDHLRRNDPRRLKEWITHLQTALPDLEDVRTVVRPDDKHRYLVIHYTGGVSVPSWVASDGTLRLLALTLPAYLRGISGIYLIEEPENGIHPRAVETMFQSVSSVYDAQVLLATHSPVILSLVDVRDVLCFAKSEGATDIIRGTDHPLLREWKGETNLATLFAAGVLG